MRFIRAKINSGRRAAGALSPEAKQRQNLAQIHQSLGFTPLGCSQTRSPVLLVQERLEALLDGLWQPKPRQVARHLDLNSNGLSHEQKLDLWPCHVQHRRETGEVVCPSHRHCLQSV